MPRCFPVASRSAWQRWSRLAQPPPVIDTSCRLFSYSAAPSPVPLLGMQQEDVVTRLGQSQRLPGLRGVFLTKPIKKFCPIEILPTAAAESSASSSASVSFSARDSNNAHSSSGSSKVTLAPPVVLNLAYVPRHRISLRRFLAMRHMFSSTAHLHVATERGWYLVAPSSATPLCADVAGLQAWVRRHHRRYLSDTSAVDLSKPQPKHSSSPREARLLKHAELTKLEAALDNGEELTQAQLRALAENEKAAERDAEEDEEDGDEDDGEDEGEAPIAVSGTGERQETTSSTASVLPQLKAVPPLIAESHLFEINDGVFWELPPSDDLANHEYWQGHRQRMSLYESTGDADATQQREAILDALRADPRSRQASEQELYAAAEELYQTLKHKANVTLSVDGETGLLTLVPLRDLQAGEELLLHYGREWWTGRLLSSLLLAVDDTAMSQVRWIEHLFGHMADHNELFPLLLPAHQQQRRRRQHRPRAHEQQGKKAAAAPGRLVLYNTVTRRRATDAAVLAFSIRRSCVHQGFFNRLILGDPARGLPPVFRVSDPDAEVPMRVLRRVLLASLRGVEEKAEINSSEATHAEAAESVAGVALVDSAAVSAERASGARGGEDDGVFSV